MALSQDDAAPTGRTLDGLRVVEIGRRLAAPIVGMLLAEHGADVVRVTLPELPAADPVLDAMLARGKAEVALRLERVDDRALLERLVAQADVVVENLPEGFLRARGLDLEKLRATRNPGLVSCRIPAFPPGDPRAAWPEHEAVAGMAGCLYLRAIGRPIHHDMPFGSLMAGLFAANGVLAALFARLTTGRGQHVEASLYDSNLFAQILLVFMKSGVPRGFVPLKMVATPFMSSWRCRDGRYAYLHITLPAHNKRVLEMLEELGHTDDVRELRSVLSPDTQRDPSKVRSIAEAKAIRRVYSRIFATRDADEWERLLGSELCCIKVRTVDEWVVDSSAAGMTDACVVDDPVFGPLTTPGAGAITPDRPADVRPREVGANVLATRLARWEATPRPTTVEGPAGPSRPPLDGVRVFDLSRVIAGPCAARVLAELGADVLSVQSPTELDWALSFHLLFNPGKRSVTLDFSGDEGKRTLHALLDDFRPHALVQNYRNLELARTIGIGPEALRGRFPGLVYVHVNAYGNEGLWKERPGFEQVVQAVSGIQMSYGRDGKPKLLPTPAIDIGTGLLGAFGALLGLYHQRRTGEGTFTASHLTRMAVFFQVERIAAAQRERALAEAQRHGIDIRHEPDRLVAARVVRTVDADAMLVGPREAIAAWMRYAGLLARDEPLPADLLGHAAARTWRGTLVHWQESIAASGQAGSVALVPAPRVRALVDGTGGPTRVQRRPYPGAPVPLAFVRAPLRMSGTPIADLAAPPLRGAHTHDVLGRVGVRVAPGTGIVPYPKDKPFLPWLIEVMRWGYFAWRSGSV